jgi:glycerol-3-phosphate dehydrogenase
MRNITGFINPHILLCCPYLIRQLASSRYEFSLTISLVETSLIQHMTGYRAIVIGAGSTGSAVAHDLALRGFEVTVVERAGVAGGTTGHNQAQLHSGARYAVTDPIAARECIQENNILRRIMPGCLELNDGLFIAVSDEGLAYKPIFLEACIDCGIPAREIPISSALRMEPNLNPQILAAVQIPDGVFDPYRFCLSFLATACQNGAHVLTFTEVIGITPHEGQVEVYQRAKDCSVTLEADIVINAAGPWVGQVALLAGVRVEVEPSAGTMVTVDGRLCNSVLNILAPPADGDIIVPQRNTCILGTTSWTVADPDDITIPPDDVERLFSVSEQMIPGIRKAPVRGIMAAARPLLVVPGSEGRQTTRGFACYDHASDGAPGFFSIVGGKTTTARLMAEKIGDLACTRLGIDSEHRTADVPLVSYRKWLRS